MSAAEGGDRGQGGGAKPKGKEKPTEDGTKARTMRKLFFLTCSAQEEGSMDNAIHNDGGGISIVH